MSAGMRISCLLCFCGEVVGIFHSSPLIAARTDCGVAFFVKKIASFCAFQRHQMILQKLATLCESRLAMSCKRVIRNSNGKFFVLSENCEANQVSRAIEQKNKVCMIHSSS